MGVIMIKICFYSSLPSWPNERLLGPEVVNHNHLGSAEVNENKIKHKWAIFGVFVRIFLSKTSQLVQEYNSNKLYKLNWNVKLLKEKMP
jgi:hypothetical protein